MAVSPIRVLLIEDLEAARLLFRLGLQRAGNNAHIAEAATLSEAESMLSKEPFDVIALDLRLPDSPAGDPLETLVWLRKRTATPIVILTTLSATLEEMERAKALGANLYLTKGTIDPILYAQFVRFARGAAGAAAGVPMVSRATASGHLETMGDKAEEMLSALEAAKLGGS